MECGYVQNALFVGAGILAAVAGWCAWKVYSAWRRKAHYRSTIQDRTSTEAAVASLSRQGGKNAQSLEERIIAYAVGLEKSLESPLSRYLSPQMLRERSWMESHADAAGLKGLLSSATFWESRVRMALGGAVFGLVLGALFSVELCAVAGIAGFVLGWRALPWAIERRTRRRARQMERSLSEMLDVVALGMRSGLSFDRSLLLYTDYFDTYLADSFRGAHRQWSCGLASREDALRGVAASYASALLARVIENVIRSLRFGSSLADELEDAAHEARSSYRAQKQEQVAKAPVKMMIPTGVLILPAMLLLILGPVLLELAGGI